MDKTKIEIEYININELKPNEYNPKKMTTSEIKHLEKSIVRFGMVDPIIVNSAENRKNIIIGGHQRYIICKRLGFDTLPVVYINVPDLKKEQELCLRLSKNVGSWDNDLLKNLDLDMLIDVGFPESIFGLPQDLDEFLDEGEQKTAKRINILLSFNSELLAEVEPYIEKILELGDVEIDRSES